MKIKDKSVRVDFHQSIWAALFQLDLISMQLTGKQIVITSGSEEGTKHGITSLHYAGCAVDIRSKHYTEAQVAQIIAKFKSDFNTPDFDIIYEGNHIHIEYQPKRR